MPKRFPPRSTVQEARQAYQQIIAAIPRLTVNLGCMRTVPLKPSEPWTSVSPELYCMHSCNANNNSLASLLPYLSLLTSMHVGRKANVCAPCNT